VNDSDGASASRHYDVVRNHEGQYSILPHGRDLPGGWERVGPSGSEEECVRHIEDAWQDMTPVSARRVDRNLGSTTSDVAEPRQ
jgi:MbtH protein